MAASIPHDEASRLSALSRYRVLDTASERVFDDLTRLAASICGAPIALISLVDEKRQWFKSRVGLEATETARDVAFCAHAIHQDDVMIVPDASADHRFAANTLVTEDPHIRFYAGAPLKVEGGQRLGTLCVIDRRPRELSQQQLHALQTLRSAVVSHLELRRALADLSALERMLPMCAWCRDIRGEDGEWQPIHEYVSKNATVTHGMCPRCATTFR